MANFVAIGDSHLKKLNYHLLDNKIDICAQGGLKAVDLENDIFDQNYDVFFLILGGNDTHCHEWKNPCLKL